MTTSDLSRRSFLAGAAAATGSAVLLGPGVRAAFAAGTAAGDTLVCIFQRGGADGLATLVPYSDPWYRRHRPRVYLPASSLHDIDGRFGMHPAMAALVPHVRQGTVGFVHAAGLPELNRSHFRAQALAETGQVGTTAPGSTWVRRHLDAIGATGSMAAVSTADALPAGASPTEPSPLALTSVAQLALGTAGWGSGERYVAELRRLYGASTDELGTAAASIFGAVDVARSIPDPYAPRNGATYPQTATGAALGVIAQLIRADVGLRVATVDVPGWDLHANAGGAQGPMAARLRELAQALATFLTDLGDRLGRITVVVLSEFGRRVTENASGGFDHGHGGVLWLAGGGIVGGRVHGAWPGLPTALGSDLAVATDTRRVLGEICEHRLGSGRAVFGDVGAPLGVTR